MGCDGGTIPKRDELVRTKKKAEQKDKIAELNFLWQHCAITQSPLREPIVACGLGKLYNKDAVIMGILDKSTAAESAKHIKSMKDVKELNLTKNPAYEGGARKGDSYQDHQNSPYNCPLLGLEMNGKFKFCFYWSCGCVFSEKALKTLKPTTCHKCQKPVDETSIVMLNAADDDLELNRSRMEERSNKLKLEKKAKKSEKLKIKDEPDDRVDEPVAGPSTVGLPAKIDADAKVKIENEKKPTIGAKLLNEKKKSDANGLKRTANGALGMRTTDYKKTKGDYSIASDPNASDVLKSLFTSSSGAKTQEKAHWITYNPFYN
ncbi:Rtf2 RING-finger [Nesidiocoris tenuis]|uniref:Replication termination factor 2 n=1 Tax=Nesidiocoris tenuis TaxID=355587 RepID=A0ABN7B5X9_9HEMI|nr:Rtf2 RING-finger [Nesidiocoris tenuis]